MSLFSCSVYGLIYYRKSLLEILYVGGSELGYENMEFWMVCHKIPIKFFPLAHNKVIINFAYGVFRIPKIWQLLKCFAGLFH